jgi:phenylpropionate dioxygenase-like ring-hydroxylating dioxygenase large terminal subunit
MYKYQTNRLDSCPDLWCYRLNDREEGSSVAYIKNIWYVAAWADEISDNKLLARKLLDVPVFFFRDTGGNPVALLDRCPHRFAPLSMGIIRGNCIECPYHGLRFDSTGECVHNPHGDGRIPARATVPSFPVVERYSAIWLWLGNPEEADPALIPEFDFMEPEQNFVGTGTMHVKGNYLLEVDNILDLSHIEFVHPMFSSPAVSKAQVTHELVDDMVWSRRDIMGDETPPDFIRQAMNVTEGPVDRWLHVHWQAPSYMALFAGGVAAGQPFEHGMVSKQAHWFTPETGQTTHYFYAVTQPRSIGPHGADIVNQGVEVLKAPFQYEDAPIIEAQQSRLGETDLMDLYPIILNVDAASTAARKIIAKKIQSEKSRAV